MQVNVNVTVSLSAETIAILKGFSIGTTAQDIPDRKVTIPVDKIEKAENPLTKVVKTPVAKATVAAAPESAVSLDSLREMVADKALTKRAEVKALLSEFGVAKVGDLPGENYDEFIEKLNQL